MLRGAEVRGFWLAWGLLSRAPVPEVADVTPADLARASRWYPLVGVAVGLIQIGALTAGSWLVHPGFGAVLCVAAGEWFTRGFHLDGFSDCLDGLLAHGDAARRLEVMKDPHVGGLGAAGVALWMSLRVAAVFALVDSGCLVWGLLAGPVFARALLAADMLLFPAASPKGLYATIRGAIRAPDAMIAALWLLIGGAALIYGLPFQGLVAVVGVLVLPLFWHRMWVGRLGGINGDVLGASVQLRELWVQACLG